MDIQELIAAGADVNVADDDGLSPLHLACVGGHAAVAKDLIDAGALPMSRCAMLICSGLYQTKELRGEEFANGAAI